MILVPGGAHEYETWDAAYLLGSLSAGDRREFEAHLDGCVSCRAAVAELSGMPALLSQMDCDALAAFDRHDRAGDAPSLQAELLPSLLAAVRWRRRRSRLVTWASTAAAAVVLAVCLLVGVQGTSVQSPADVAALPMTQVHTSLLVSTVSLDSEGWGTFIVMNCVCLAPDNAHHDTLAMVVVGRDGSRTRLATWVANPGHTATPAGNTSMTVDQIAAVQVVSADDGQVLLQRTL